MLLVVDGLDEFDGQYMELLEIILEWRNRPYVKTCLASRPETAILAKLGSFPTLRLQDLNEGDISKFVWDKLRGDDLRDYEEQLTEILISRLICRSEGIFLWAHLVVESMIPGCLVGDDTATLLLRLDETPEGLDALFKQLLSRVDKVHHESLSLCLFHLDSNNCARTSEFDRSVSLIAASLPICQDMNSTDDFLDACTRTSATLVAQWKGMVEIEDESEFLGEIEERYNECHC